MAEVPVRCVAVALVALRKRAGRREVLLLRRTRSLRGEWCQVAGAIEGAETAWRAALRELHEETGLTPSALYSADICEQFYEPHLNVISLLPVFVAYVEPFMEVALNDEHSEHRWVSFADAAGMVPFAGQRQVLRHVAAEFAERAPSPHLRIDVA